MDLQPTCHEYAQIARIGLLVRQNQKSDAGYRMHLSLIHTRRGRQE